MRPSVGGLPCRDIFNLCQIDLSLKVTTAMAAGVSDMLRDTVWFVGLIDVLGPKPRRPEICSKRPKPG